MLLHFTRRIAARDVRIFSYYLAYYNTYKDKDVQYKFSPNLTSTSLPRIKTHLSQVRLQERKLSETLGYVLLVLCEVQYVLLLQTGHVLGLCCSNLTTEIDISTSSLPRFKDQSTP